MEPPIVSGSHLLAINAKATPTQASCHIEDRNPLKIIFENVLTRKLLVRILLASNPMYSSPCHLTPPHPTADEYPLRKVCNDAAPHGGPPCLP